MFWAPPTLSGASPPAGATLLGPSAPAPGSLLAASSWSTCRDHTASSTSTSNDAGPEHAITLLRTHFCRPPYERTHTAASNWNAREPVLQPRGVDRPAPPAVWSRHRGLTGSGEFVDFSRTEVQLAPAPSRRVGTTGMPTGTSPAHVLQRLPTPLPPSGHSSA